MKTATNGYDPDYPTVPDAPSFGKPPSAWIDDSYRFWRGNNYSLNYNTDSSKLNLFKNDQFRDEWVRTKHWAPGSNPRRGAAALGFKNQTEWQQAIGVLEPEHGMSYELGWKKQFEYEETTGYEMPGTTYSIAWQKSL